MRGLTTCKGLRAEIYNAKGDLASFVSIFDSGFTKDNIKDAGKKSRMAGIKIGSVWGMLYPAIADLQQMDRWRNLGLKDFQKRLKKAGYELSPKKRRLTYRGDIILDDSTDLKIPPGYMDIVGNLIVKQRSRLSKMSDDLFVAGDCKLIGDNMYLMPNNLTVAGNLFVGDEVEYLKDDIDVQGDMQVPRHLSEMANKLKEQGKIRGLVLNR